MTAAGDREAPFADHSRKNWKTSMTAMNHKPYFAYRSFWPELDTMKRMNACGIDTICFYPSNTLNSLGEPYCKYPPTWLWYDRYDFSSLDRQIADILSAVPAARLICLVDVNSPEWLVKNRPGFDSFNALGHAVCDPDWRRLVAAYLAAFLRHAETHHGDRIEAYALAGGYTTEWQDLSNGTESPSKTMAFQKWCGDRGLPVPSDIPPLSVRGHVTHEGLLRDPETDRLALDYWRFCSDAVADAIAFFVGQAREVIPPHKHLGAFYGYALELGGERLLPTAHLAYERVLDLPGLDFLISPGTYRDRKIGGGSGFMTPMGTVRLKGKAFLHECDHRTHTYNRDLSPHVRMEVPHAWPDQAASVAGLQREMALALIQGTSLWWFDMWGGFYRDEAVCEMIRAMKVIWDRFAGETFDSVAETALIVDPGSFPYLRESGLADDSHREGMRPEGFARGIRNALNRLGAPYDIYSMRDIPSIPSFDRYRFVIFATPFEIDGEKEAMLHQHVLRDGRTVAWLHAAGVSDGRHWTPERMKTLCGIPCGTPGIARADMGDWQSVVAADPDDLTPARLKELAAAAGVTLTCREAIPVFANTRLLAVHAADGGRIQITLPFPCDAIRELFSDEVVARDCTAFEHDFTVPGTCLFELDAKP
jgi:hypothetical protein